METERVGLWGWGRKKAMGTAHGVVGTAVGMWGWGGWDIGVGAHGDTEDGLWGCGDGNTNVWGGARKVTGTERVGLWGRLWGRGRGTERQGRGAG